MDMMNQESMILLANEAINFIDAIDQERGRQRFTPPNRSLIVAAAQVLATHRLADAVGDVVESVDVSADEIAGVNMRLTEMLKEEESDE